VSDPTNPENLPRDAADPPGAQSGEHKATEPLNQSKPSAADRLLGHKTSKIVKDTVERATREKDKTVIIMTIIGSAILIGVVGVALLNRKQVTQPQQMVYTPQFDVGMSSQEEIRSFTTKTAREVTEINRQISELSQTMKGLIERQDKTEGFVKDTLREAKDAFERSGSEKVKLMEEYAKLGQGAAQKSDPRTKLIIDDLRQSLAMLKESPAEAKARAATLLRQAGVPEDQIRNILAEVALQAGRIAVGDIAEAPATAEEIKSLPDWAQPYFATIHNRLGVIALTEGRFYPEQTAGDIGHMLKAKEHERAAEITDELCRKIADIARVRRENITPDMEDALPFLITARDQNKIARDDRAAVASLVFRAKDHVPAEATAGQLLSICHVVGRTIGATAAKTADSGFRQLDDNTTVFAVEVVTTAVGNAVQLGKNQAEQYDIAGRALANYLDTSRLTASDEQRKHIILRAMSGALKRHGDHVDKQEPAVKEPTPASKHDPTDSILFFGPLRLDRLRVQRAMVYAIPSLMTANNIDSRGAKGAAAMVSAIEQVPRVVADMLPHYLGQPMGGRDYFQSALPQLIYALRMGESLGGIPLPVSADLSNESSREAELVRGAAIGAIFGPLIHDEEKAKAVAHDAAAQLEAKPPLTREAAAALAQVPDSEPVAAVLTAMDAVRPGRFAYPAERFQDVVIGINGLYVSARELRKQVRTQLVAGQEGVYDENIRILVPMSIASHDDLRIPVTDLIELARADVMNFTALFICEGRLSQLALEAMIPKYAPAMAEEAGGGSALVQTAIELIPATLYEIFSNRTPKVGADNISDVVQSLSDEASPVVEFRIVQQVVLSRVVPRIKRAGTLSDKESVSKALAHANKRVRDLVAAPYTPPRIDHWATVITDECRHIVSGGTVNAAAADVQGNPGNNGRGKGGMWPTPVMIPASVGGQLVGTSSSLVRTKQIVIPANTYGNAHVQTGVDAEIGGRGNIPVLLQMDFDWVGPANARIVMRGCRVSGIANAMAGPERVSIDLKTLSYVFPSGREINSEVKGYVADNLEGMYGVLGTYKWNAEKVLPYAVISGGFKGAADALKANSTTTIVGNSTTTTVANQGDQLKQALYGGVGEGFGIMSDYVQQVLKEVHPSVSTPNGQRVSVVLLEPVVMQVPEAEFEYLSAGSSGSFSK
jgi:hypothetical protein